MRYAGAGLLIAVCYLAGHISASRQKKTICNLRGFVRLLERIKTAVATGESDIARVFENFDDAYLDGCGYLAEIRRGGTASVYSALPLLCLPEELNREIRPCASRLGCLCAAAQLTELESTLSVLQKRYDELYAGSLQKQKATRAVWGLAGALVALLLI